MADDYSQWTPEELMAELRARERAGAGAPARTAWTPSVPKADKANARLRKRAGKKR